MVSKVVMRMKTSVILVEKSLSYLTILVQLQSSHFIHKLREMVLGGNENLLTTKNFL